jgi:hypothetical protein
MLYVKNDFVLFVILTWRMRVAITSLLRDKLPPFKRVLLFFNFYSFCNFISVIESKFMVLYDLQGDMCVLLCPHVNLDHCGVIERTSYAHVEENLIV